jgi:hypothetical protein
MPGPPILTRDRGLAIHYKLVQFLRYLLIVSSTLAVIKIVHRAMRDRSCRSPPRGRSWRSPGCNRTPCQPREPVLAPCPGGPGAKHGLGELHFEDKKRSRESARPEARNRTPSLLLCEPGARRATADSGLRASQRRVLKGATPMRPGSRPLSLGWQELRPWVRREANRTRRARGAGTGCPCGFPPSVRREKGVTANTATP